MQQIVLVIHLLIAVAMVGVVLLQRSEGGGLGMGGGGGGGGGMSGFMTGRSQANLLTRTTAILAACFMVTSLVLAALASGGARTTSILDQPLTEQSTPAPAIDAVPESAPASDPGTAPAGDQPTAPATTGETAPAVPSVPLGQ